MSIGFVTSFSVLYLQIIKEVNHLYGEIIILRHRHGMIKILEVVISISSANWPAEKILRIILPCNIDEAPRRKLPGK